MTKTLNLAPPYARESLLNIPLLRQMLADRAFRLVPRRIDREWAYHGVLPLSVRGFNPMQGAAYYGAKSAFASWLEQPTASIRRLNENDVLVEEALFAVHDYLHAWAYRAIHELHPKLKFGTAAITPQSIEDFAFCHLLTEAVATVGLDYWYLATKDFNEICNVGSRMTGLTTGYRETSLREFQRHNSAFMVQRPEFLAEFTRFYCTGIFSGFAIGDLKRSPQLLTWLENELTYGEQQRIHTRRWLRYLAHTPIELSDREIARPVSVEGAAWKRALLHELPTLLWQKVKEDRLHTFSSCLRPDEVWTSATDKAIDYRFVNLNRVPLRNSTVPPSMVADDFDYLFCQYVSRFEHSQVDPELMKLLGTVRTQKDVSLLRYLFRNQPLVGTRSLVEPRDLFLPN